MTHPLERIILDDAGADAIDAVMTVMEQAFDPRHGEGWNRAQCLAMIGLPGVWLTLARDRAGEPVGFSLCRAVLDDAELLLIATVPAIRGQGVGSLLLDAAIRGAGDRGAIRLHLEVRDGNPAVRLYERHDFVMMGRRPGYYGGADGTRRDALTLSRSLGAA